MQASSSDVVTAVTGVRGGTSLHSASTVDNGGVGF